MKPRLLVPATDIKSKKSLEHLETCLTSIKDYHDFNTTVCFDSTSREFVEYFTNKFQIDEVIHNTGNRLNFSRNVNLGLRKCRERRETVLLLNQDTALRPEQSKDLYKVCSVVGITNLKCHDDPLTIPEGSGVIEETGGKVAFFATIINHEVLSKIGVLMGFARGSFEDDDYQVRARLAGFKIYVADHFVYHMGSYASTEPGWDGISSSGSYNQEDLNFNLNRFLTKWQVSCSHAEAADLILKTHVWNDSMVVN